MRMLQGTAIAAAIFMTMLTACVSALPPGGVPTGRYDRAESQEFVLIDYDRICLFVREDHPVREELTPWILKYQTLDDGRLNLFDFPSSSSVSHWGPWYDIWWSGSELILIHQPTGERRIFVRRAYPSPPAVR